MPSGGHNKKSVAQHHRAGIFRQDRHSLPGRSRGVASGHRWTFSSNCPALDSHVVSASAIATKPNPMAIGGKNRQKYVKSRVLFRENGLIRRTSMGKNPVLLDKHAAIVHPHY